MPEKFFLKWDDFQNNLVGSFQELRKDRDFADVTLACQDQQLEVHKVVLSAASHVFQCILKKNRNKNPLIYLRGITSKELVSIVDFIYHGEVRIYEDDLNKFLQLAEEFQLRGLTGFEQPFKEQNIFNTGMKIEPSEANTTTNSDDKHNERKSVAISETTQKEISGIGADVAKQIKSMIKKHGGIWTCKFCGLEKKHKGHVMEHVESHIEGLEFPCNMCGKVYRSYKTHIYRRCN